MGVIKIINISRLNCSLLEKGALSWLPKWREWKYFGTGYEVSEKSIWCIFKVNLPLSVKLLVFLGYGHHHQPAYQYWNGFKLHIRIDWRSLCEFLKLRSRWWQRSLKITFCLLSLKMDHKFRWILLRLCIDWRSLAWSIGLAIEDIATVNTKYHLFIISFLFYCWPSIISFFKRILWLDQ